MSITAYFRIKYLKIFIYFKDSAKEDLDEHV